MPRFSVVMPCYNAAETLSSSIKSVLDQTLDDFELLIVDDRSTDATAKLLSSIDDPRIRTFANDQRNGAAATRNVAVREATGRYIAFLDADDLWLPVKLETQLKEFETSQAPLVYSSYFAKSSRGKKLIRAPKSVDYRRLLYGNSIGCLTAVYDTNICGKQEMPLIRRRHDYALWLRILKQFGPAAGTEEPLAIYNRSATSLSSNKIAATYDTWKMFRNEIGLSRSASLRSVASHVVSRAFR